MKPGRVDLQNPFQGRRWLRLLRPDPTCGFRLQPQLDVPARSLGFSLNSNGFGLRGPDDATGNNVIIGSSFAMGIAVNNGENWWELGLPGSDWLNLGLAVGFREWDDLLKRFYRGSFKSAWLLYHPNFWTHCRAYERWRTSGGDVFQALRWRTDLAWCAYLSVRRALRRPRQLRSGRLLQIPSSGAPMEIDTEYVHLDPDGATDLFERSIDILTGILSQFREVKVVRLRVKQEAVPEANRNEFLRRTCRGYDRWYEATRSRLSRLTTVRELEPPPVRLEDFHHRDSHWNAEGNRRFASWLREQI